MLANRVVSIPTPLDAAYSCVDETFSMALRTIILRYFAVIVTHTCSYRHSGITYGMKHLTCL
jgi:hypothetical protein